jgi:hypothetical protein
VLVHAVLGGERRPYVVDEEREEPLRAAALDDDVADSVEVADVRAARIGRVDVLAGVEVVGAAGGGTRAARRC